MYQTNEVREDFLPHHRDQVCQLSNVNGNELTIQHQIQHPVSNEQLQQQQQQQSHDNLYHVYELGFYGWKKKCLYLFIVTVTIVILINALLTLWIIAILSFSMNGIGKLNVIQNELKLDGDAFLLKDVYAKNICSRKNHHIRFNSKNKIHIDTRRPNDKELINRLFIDKTIVNCLSNQFVVRTPDGKSMFLVSDNSTVMATDKLRVNNAAGIKFNGSIQVPLVQSNTFELNMLSPTRKIKLRGPQKISIQSQSGHIHASSSGNLNLISKGKSILFDSYKIELNDLRTAYPTKRGKTYPGIHQLCICSNTGKLFIAPPDGPCFVDDKVCADHISKDET